MPFKIENDNFVKDSNGNPIFIYDDEVEAGVDPVALATRIKEINAESKKHRLSAKKYKADLERLKTEFDGLDPQTARANAELIKNIDESKLLSADKVETLKRTIRDEFATNHKLELTAQKNDFRKKLETLQAKYDETAKRLDQGEVDRGLMDSLTAGIIKEKTNLGNLRAVRGYFGGQFKRDPESGKMVGYHWDSNRKIISTNTENAGEPADIETCLKILYSTDPHKDGISKTLPGGGGLQGGGGGGGQAGDILLSAADATNPVLYRAAKEKAAKAGSQVVFED
jgi:hypothetical protein